MQHTQYFILRFKCKTTTPWSSAQTPKAQILRLFVAHYGHITYIVPKCFPGSYESSLRTHIQTLARLLVPFLSLSQGTRICEHPPRNIPVLTAVWASQYRHKLSEIVQSMHDNQHTTGLIRRLIVDFHYINQLIEQHASVPINSSI